jgi:hypothetical protein
MWLNLLYYRIMNAATALGPGFPTVSASPLIFIYQAPCLWDTACLLSNKGLRQRWWQSGMCSLKHNVFVIHCVLSNKLSKRLIQLTIEACRLLSSCNCVFSKETTWAWWINKIYLSTYSDLRLRAPQSFARFTHPSFYQICFQDPC